MNYREGTATTRFFERERGRFCPFDKRILMCRRMKDLTGLLSFHSVSAKVIERSDDQMGRSRETLERVGEIRP